MRQLLEDTALQAGVVGATDLKVAQRGAGANMSVDVPAGQAWVEVTTGTRNGLAHVVNDATANVVVSASNGTNPRIDQIILRYNDSSIPTGSGDVPTLAVLTGTATGGATLDNRTGAAALSADSIRLADILVPAASSSVTTANIRDRRPWARGARFTMFRQSTDIASASTTFANLDATGLACRLEISAPIVKISFSTIGFYTATGVSEIRTAVFMDGAITAAQCATSPPALNVGQPIVATFGTGVPAGSHLFEVRGKTAANTANWASSVTQGAFTCDIEEVVRPNVANT